MTLARFVVVFLILLSVPNNAAARPGGGFQRTGGGAQRPAGSVQRPAGAVQRPAGGMQQPQAARPTTPQGGFNLNRDVGASRPATANNANLNRNVNNANVNRNAANVNRNVNTANVNRNVNTANVNRNVNVNNVNVNRTVVANPVYTGPAWGWNHGVAWYPAPTYWGGGFWGSLAVATASAAVFGAVVNSTTHQTVTSYQVQANSPGATLLSNYHLTQTQCGPPNLVVIYGPNNSVICANPNDIVAAGNYNLNTDTLTLVSQ